MAYIGEWFPRSDVVALWHLNGNFTDSSANGYNLTPTATPADLQGPVAGAKDFNGTSQYALIAHASAPALEMTGDQTWYMRMKFDIPNTNDARIIDKRTNSRSFWHNGNDVWFHMGQTNGQRAESDALTAGTWYSIFGVCNKSVNKLQIWVDGRMHQETNMTTTLDASTDPFTIGAYRGGGGNWFNGQLDEVCIFNRALTATEIRKYEAWRKAKY